jgi:hypothetical protein
MSERWAVQKVIYNAAVSWQETMGETFNFYPKNEVSMRQAASSCVTFLVVQRGWEWPKEQKKWSHPEVESFTLIDLEMKDSRMR